MLKFKGSCKGDKTTKSLTKKRLETLKLHPLPTDAKDAEEVKLKVKNPGNPGIPDDSALSWSTWRNFLGTSHDLPVSPLRTRKNCHLVLGNPFSSCGTWIRSDRCRWSHKRSREGCSGGCQVLLPSWSLGRMWYMFETPVYVLLKIMIKQAFYSRELDGILEDRIFLQYLWLQTLHSMQNDGSFFPPAKTSMGSLMKTCVKQSVWQCIFNLIRL